MTFVFQFMLMLVSLYGLNTSAPPPDDELDEPLLDELLLDDAAPDDELLLDDALLEAPLPPVPFGHVAPPGSHPVPQLTGWQWYPCPRFVVVQPQDSPTCPTHALASLPMYTHALGSHVPPLPEEPLLLELLPEPWLPPVPPLLDEVEVDALPELDDDVAAPEPEGQETGSHSAGTALGSQPGSLVCAWRQA